jgi:phosphoribosyl 1,2-cyclic phosphodiesterase
VSVIPEERLSVRFWGVRGSLPAPGAHTIRYGGETTCFEVMVGTRRIVVDCGSGGRPLGKLLAREGPRTTDVLFTHSHMDHICGLPFFAPAYDPAFDIRLWAGHVPSAEAHREVIERLMSPPIFPVPTTALCACAFRAFSAGESIEPQPGLVVDTCRLHHPGGATGYRFRHAGRTLCIITDHEHGHPDIDPEVERFVTGADVMVYDAMYTDAEYPQRIGWGHSTWQQALALSERASVRMPVIMHHEPSRTDDMLDDIQAAMEARFPGSRVAREGEEISA